MSDGAVRRLVILDLNGLLIHRIHERDTADLDRDFLESATYYRPFYIWKRPHVDEFLNFLFQHFTVAVWTSAQKRNAENMIPLLLGNQSPPFLFVWDQSKCNADTLSEEQWAEELTKPPRKRRRRKRWLFTKPLAKVWEAFPEYNATNTLLIDDSVEKTIENPPGLFYCPPSWFPTTLPDLQNDYALKCSLTTAGNMDIIIRDTRNIYQWLKGLSAWSGNVASYVFQQSIK